MVSRLGLTLPKKKKREGERVSSSSSSKAAAANSTRAKEDMGTSVALRHTGEPESRKLRCRVRGILLSRDRRKTMQVSGEREKTSASKGSSG